MKPPRIAILADHPPFTGIGKFTFSTFYALRDHSLNIDLYFIRWSKKDWTPASLPVKELSALPFYAPIKTLGLISSYIQRNRLIPPSYDIYHASQPLLLPILPKKGVSIVSVQDVLPLLIPENHPFFFNLLFRISIGSLDSAEVILAESHAVRQDLIDIIKIRPKKVRVVYPGVSHLYKPGQPQRSRLGLPEHKKIILTVGTDEKRKNIPFLLHVLWKVSKRMREVVLVHVGQPTPRSEKCAKDLSIQDHVLYRSQLTEEELAELYRSADLFMSCSTVKNGYSILPVMEAMASGCPVIGSTNREGDEIMGNGGISLPPDNLDIWAETVEMVLHDATVKTKLGRAGVERASEFSWRRTAIEIANIYSEVAGSPIGDR